MRRNLNDIGIITKWERYIPIYVGFGTVATTTVHWRQVGESIEVRGVFTAGTPTAVAANIRLPKNLNAATYTWGTNVIGQWWRNNASATAYKRGSIIGSSAIGPNVNMGIDDYTNALSPFVAKNGSDICGVGEDVAFYFSVPIEGFRATKKGR
jgi:hypothetical protein